MEGDIQLQDAVEHAQLFNQLKFFLDGLNLSVDKKPSGTLVDELTKTRQKHLRLQELRNGVIGNYPRLNVEKKWRFG